MAQPVKGGPEYEPRRSDCSLTLKYSVKPNGKEPPVLGKEVGPQGASGLNTQLA